MRRRLGPVILVLVIAGSATALYLQLRADRGLTDRLVLSGTVEATTIEVGSEVSGRVARVAVQQGDRVAPGDVIAELTTDAQQARVAQAEAASGAARQREQQSSVSTAVQAGILAAEVARSEQALETAHARLTEVLAGARPEVVEEARAGVRAAEAQVIAAREQLAKAQAGPREQEIAQARAAVEQADEAVNAAQAALDELRAGTRAQDIEQARAALESAQAQAEKAARDAARMRSLHSDGVVSSDGLERAETAAKTAMEQVRAAEAALSKALEGPRAQTIRAAEASLAQAQAARRQAAEQLALLEAGSREEDIRAARAQVAQAEQGAQAARARLAALEAGPTAEQIAVARRQVHEAEAAVRLAHQRAREVQVSEEQIQVARREAERAEAGADEAAIALGKHIVTAPDFGVVDSVNVEQGEVVSPGTSVVTLLVPDELWVTVFVPEPMLPRVQVGQAAQVMVDGWERPFTGHVSWIAQEAEFTPKNVLTEDERTRQVYRERIRPHDPEGLHKAGMPAD
ncbi:MAG: HlyD family efflux transporter periplasmic adaptor subunit, partial [Armatimonadota bacterium]